MSSLSLLTKGLLDFLKQLIIRDHFDPCQCERFRHQHCRFVGFFCSSRVSELFGVISAAGFRGDTWGVVNGTQPLIQALTLERLVPYAG